MKAPLASVLTACTHNRSSSARSLVLTTPSGKLQGGVLCCVVRSIKRPLTKHGDSGRLNDSPGVYLSELGSVVARLVRCVCRPFRQTRLQGPESPDLSDRSSTSSRIKALPDMRLLEESRLYLRWRTLRVATAVQVTLARSHIADTPTVKLRTGLLEDIGDDETALRDALMMRLTHRCRHISLAACAALRNSTTNPEPFTKHRCRRQDHTRWRSFLRVCMRCSCSP
jgi:hypothetical protein